MQAIAVLSSAAIPLPIDKIDTGMILPGRFMRQHRRPGHDYANAFLHDLRFGDDETPRMECPLNFAAYRGATILIAGADFGCGSSREGAAYAVLDYGLRALIAPSFGDIFYGNCLQNGVLAVPLPATQVHELVRQVSASPGASVTVDLPAQRVVAPDGTAYPFDINPTRKERLLRGMDDIDITLEHRPAIEAYETRHAKRIARIAAAVTQATED